ncbi:uncharacterized protein RHOBADRAFT_55840 [Rhodotorula graminis WP1]|uniref:RNase III domain-containing protein n=1 Tax=Rhodotorula graminis (strain WP1) TaxID=578459 RepID=A0A0P9GY74_RHOGW|nr:uncharacterized protein RHOBADRAFT_55840 [Rhodotorula graminis WP1]KPV72364.1 hypothetical protein RHOBADRAFT_55840 [Rhodotorula graminis WP1]
MLSLLASRLRPAFAPLAHAAPPALGRLDRHDRAPNSRVPLARLARTRLLSSTPVRLASALDLDSPPRSSSSSCSSPGRAGKIPFLQRESKTAKVIEYDPLARVRSALGKKVPTAFPKILDHRLVDLLAGRKSNGLDPVFSSAYHPEVLEFLGDRIWDVVVSQTLVLLAARGKGSKILGTIGAKSGHLLSNAHGAVLAKEFKLVHWSGRSCCGGKGSCSNDAAADAWEAHLGALFLANGRQAVLDFLVPLVKRDFLKPVAPKRAVSPVVAPAKVQTAMIVAVQPSLALVKAVSAADVDRPSPPVVASPAARVAQPPSAPVAQAPSALVVDPSVVLDSWQSAFAAAETSTDHPPLRKAPKGSLTKKPLVYRSHKLAIQNVLADLKERGADHRVVKVTPNRYRLHVAKDIALVAKGALPESDRVGLFVSKLVKAGLVKISKKPTKALPKVGAPAAPPSSKGL